METAFKLAKFTVIGVLLGWSTGALSTTFEQLSLEALTDYSSVVVRGKFVKTEGMFTEDKSAIYTRAVFQVDETIAGRMSAKEIVVYLPGGTVGDLTTFVVGAPEIEVGADHVLMLDAAPRAQATARPVERPEFNIVGLSQGMFDIKRDPDTKEMIATSHATRFLKASQIEENRLPGGAEGMRLDDLVVQIREIAVRPKDQAVAPGDEGEGESGDPEEEYGEPGADEGEEGEPDENAEEEGSEVGGSEAAREEEQ